MKKRNGTAFPLLYRKWTPVTAEDRLPRQDDQREEFPACHLDSTRFGTHEVLGQAILEPDGSAFLAEDLFSFTLRDHFDATALEVDLAVCGLVDAAHQRAFALLKDAYADLEAGARLVMGREAITPDDFPALEPQKARAA